MCGGGGVEDGRYISLPAPRWPWCRWCGPSLQHRRSRHGRARVDLVRYAGFDSTCITSRVACSRSNWQDWGGGALGTEREAWECFLSAVPLERLLRSMSSPPRQPRPPQMGKIFSRATNEMQDRPVLSKCAGGPPAICQHTPSATDGKMDGQTDGLKPVPGGSIQKVLLHPNPLPLSCSRRCPGRSSAEDEEKEARRQGLTRSTWTIGSSCPQMPTPVIIDEAFIIHSASPD